MIRSRRSTGLSTTASSSISRLCLCLRIACCVFVVVGCKVVLVVAYNGCVFVSCVLWLCVCISFCWLYIACCVFVVV